MCLLNNVCPICMKPGCHVLKLLKCVGGWLHERHPLRGNKEERRTKCDRKREEGGMMETDDNESEDLNAISTSASVHFGTKCST